MSILVDTNVLSRIAEPHHRQNAAAAGAVHRLLTEGKVINIVPQNAYEFWVVATRPVSSNGLGMTTADANAFLDQLFRIVKLLPETPDIFPEWQKLVNAVDCKGKSAHDARLVAAMRVHGISEIITFNRADFVRYPGITITAPEDVVARP